LPAAIGDLNELRHFNVAGNRFAKISERIANLTRLRVCDLPDSPLLKLPEAFGQVQIVNRLRVRNTGFASLPEGFATMRATIDVREMKIDLAVLSPAMRPWSDTEKPPGLKEVDKIIVRQPEKR
jgi:Leucine-rich repeat (LRR) protein